MSSSLLVLEEDLICIAEPRNFAATEAVLTIMRRILSLTFLTALQLPIFAQTSFDVASIRLSAERVPFERNGRTTITREGLQMRDVSIRVCLAFAYDVSTAQIGGPSSINDKHYDILAKVDHEVGESQMREMMKTLLTERFHVSLHHEQREMRGYVLSVLAQPKNPAKFHPSAAPGDMYRENSATGTLARNITMNQFAAFLSGPLDGPVSDETHLQGQYDLVLDFTSYVDVNETDRSRMPSPSAILNSALKGELGLEITPKKATFDTLIVDRSEDPTPN